MFKHIKDTGHGKDDNGTMPPPPLPSAAPPQPASQPRGKPSPCTQCGMELPSKRSLQRHMKAEHPAAPRAATPPPQNDGRPAGLNLAAANRFIKAALASDYLVGDKVASEIDALNARQEDADDDGMDDDDAGGGGDLDVHGVFRDDAGSDSDDSQPTPVVAIPPPPPSTRLFGMPQYGRAPLTRGVSFDLPPLLDSLGLGTEEAPPPPVALPPVAPLPPGPTPPPLTAGAGAGVEPVFTARPPPGASSLATGGAVRWAASPKRRSTREAFRRRGVKTTGLPDPRKARAAEARRQSSAARLVRFQWGRKLVGSKPVPPGNVQLVGVLQYPANAPAARPMFGTLGAAAVTTPSGVMVLFGGNADGGSEPQPPAPALPVLDPTANAWACVPTHAASNAHRPPGDLRHHSATGFLIPDGPIVLVYGGAFLSRRGAALSDSTFALSLATMTWSALKPPGPCPGPRYGHTTTTVSAGATEGLVLFGGCDGRVDRNDVMVLMHKAAGGASGLGCLGWEKYRVGGDAIPCGRRFHSAVAVGQRLLVYGGFAGFVLGSEGSTQPDGGHLLGDCFTLDVTTKDWEVVEPVGPRPPPRCGHSATILQDTMLVFGGRVTPPGAPAVFGNVFEDTMAADDTWVLNMTTRVWTRVQVENVVSPRAFHTANLIVYGGAPVVVVLGGDGDGEGGSGVACLCVAPPEK